jgi:choline dehydrogenase
VQPTDGRNITGDFDPAVHGFDGMTRVSLPNEVQPLFDERFFNAADELGGNFSFNLDTNAGKNVGAGV